MDEFRRLQRALRESWNAVKRHCQVPSAKINMIPLKWDSQRKTMHWNRIPFCVTHSQIAEVKCSAADDSTKENLADDNKVKCRRQSHEELSFWTPANVTPAEHKIMDGFQMVATSIGVIGVILLMVLFACRFFGPKTTAWICSNREEKIGFSKNKLYHANGYLVSSINNATI